MTFAKFLFAVCAFVYFFTFDSAHIQAQKTKSPQQIKILNNYGSIPFEDGETVIAEIIFTGLDSDYVQSDETSENLLTEEEVLKNLRLNRTTIRVGEEFYGYKVAKAVKTIREWLTSEGYDKVEVDALGEKVPKNQMKLIFSIKRGALARVTEIRFDENVNVSNEELVADFKQCRGIDWKIFDSRKYDYIARKCSLSLMVSKGYFQAKIKNINRRLVDDSYIVTIEVHEGIRYRIGEIKIEGAKVFTEKEILEMSGQKKGDVADGKALLNFFNEKLKSVYADKGYMLYNAEFNPTFIEPQTEGLDGIVNIIGTIYEGAAFKLTKIEFSGIEKEKAQELRKLFSLNDGEIYNQSKFEKGVKKIDVTKEFYEIDIDTDVEMRTDEENYEFSITLLRPNLNKQ